ncbi:MAG: hypothetical protein M3R04_05175 [bacterium]|nr:hypothetical protein [bacterium]
MRCCLLIILVAVALFGAGCPKKTTESFKGKNRDMVEAAQQIRVAIITYHAETSEYPSDIRSAESHLGTGVTWPNNPYNGQPIRDNFGHEFDPAKSVGTVYYEIFTRDEQIAGYRLHVYGDKGRLMIFDNSAFGAL